MAAAGSAVELDFFRMEKESSSPKPHPKKLFDRRRSFRDIQSVISKMNPALLKSVIATGSVDQSSNSTSKPSEKPLTPKHFNGSLFPVLPVYTTPFWSNTCGGSESTPAETSPLTIFYNGTVAVFNVPRHKADNILKMAELGGGVFKTVESQEPKLAMLASGDQHQLLETLDGDLPIARRKSLHRFMEKRKERLTLVSPYGCLTDYVHSRKNTSRHGD